MRSRLLPSLLKSRKLLYEYLKPCTINVGTYSQLKQIRIFSSKSQKCPENYENVENQSDNLAGSFSGTHKVFEDKDAEVILDITERQETINLEDLRIQEEPHDPYEGINLERGISGVFEIEDLVSLLRRDNAKNIFVASVPSELQYVDYMVVVTGRSKKHMLALATFVRKVYKMKKHKTDTIPKIEGEKSKDWIALDLGNIILHIFSKSARELYDLESLWSVGPDYDDLSKGITDADMERYGAFLSGLEPIESNENVQINKK